MPTLKLKMEQHGGCEYLLAECRYAPSYTGQCSIDVVSYLNCILKSVLAQLKLILNKIQNIQDQIIYIYVINFSVNKANVEHPQHMQWAPK